MSFCSLCHDVLMIFHPFSLTIDATMIYISELCLGFATIQGGKEAPIGRNGFLTTVSIETLPVRWTEELLL